MAGLWGKNAMSLSDVWNIVAAGVMSIGGGGAIVFGLSSWLGKVWANSFMEREKATHARDLEQLRSELQRNNEVQLSNLKKDLDIYKQKHLRGHEDKVQIYRLAVDVITDLLGDLDLLQQTPLEPKERLGRWDKFNRGRHASLWLRCHASPTVGDGCG